METLNRSAVLAKVTAFTKAIAHADISLDQAFLYGSYAYGVPHIWSDIDVLLVRPSNSSFSEADWDAYLGIASQEEFVGISPLIITKDKLFIGSLFLKEILPKAIRIPIGEKTEVVEAVR